MLALLQWRQQVDLPGMLNKFSFVNHSEIVKFLRETFDSLFAILVSQNCQTNTKLALQVYDAIVNTIQLLYDEKQGQSSRSALDNYIQHFELADFKSGNSGLAPSASAPSSPTSSSRLKSSSSTANIRRTSPTGAPDEADSNFGRMHKNLMFCLREQFKELTATATPSPSSGKKLIPTVKALDYLFKFLLASRSLYDRINPSEAARTCA